MEWLIRFNGVITLSNNNPDKGYDLKNVSKFLLIVGYLTFITIIMTLVFGFDLDDKNNIQKKVGYFSIGSIEESGWSNEHYKGLKAACDKYKLQMLVRGNIEENSGQSAEVIKEFINANAGIIFMMSYNYPLENENLITQNPNIEFIANSSMLTAKNFTGGFPKMYQGRYLTGALAGMRTKSNVIGYVAAMPNSEVYRGINAFTLGVQAVNPNAKVVVAWTDNWNDAEAESEQTERLIKNAKADIITYHVDHYKAIADKCEELDTDFIAYNFKLEGYSDHYLTSVVCNWEEFYKKILRLYLKKELFTVKNYWLGIQDGTVKLTDFSPSVTQDQRDKIELLTKNLKGSEKIFIGPIYDSNGNLRCDVGEVINDNVLLEHMDWLVKGVEFLE